MPCTPCTVIITPPIWIHCIKHAMYSLHCHHYTSYMDTLHQTCHVLLALSSLHLLYGYTASNMPCTPCTVIITPPIWIHCIKHAMYSLHCHHYTSYMDTLHQTCHVLLALSSLHLLYGYTASNMPCTPCTVIITPPIWIHCIKHVMYSLHCHHYTTYVNNLLQTYRALHVLSSLHHLYEYTA